jgi:hypothetical protein
VTNGNATRTPRSESTRAPEPGSPLLRMHA